MQLITLLFSLIVLAMVDFSKDKYVKNNSSFRKYLHRNRRELSNELISADNLRLRLLRQTRSLRSLLRSWENHNSEDCKFEVSWKAAVARFSSTENPNIAILHLKTGLHIFDQFQRYCSSGSENQELLSLLSSFLNHLREYVRRYDENSGSVNVSHQLPISQRTLNFTSICLTNLHDYIHGVLRNSIQNGSSRRKRLKGKELYIRYLFKCRS